MACITDVLVLIHNAYFQVLRIVKFSLYMMNLQTCLVFQKMYNVVRYGYITRSHSAPQPVRVSRVKPRPPRNLTPPRCCHHRPHIELSCDRTYLQPPAYQPASRYLVIQYI